MPKSKEVSVSPSEPTVHLESLDDGAIAVLTLDDSKGTNVMSPEMGCSDASWCSSGCRVVSPVSGTCPVATVVISGGGAGDQSAGSPDVKVPVGWAKAWSAPTGGRASRQVVAQANRS